MQLSYFSPYAADGHPARIATVRAGNVIGGGDWSEDRLVPDIIRGCLGASGEVQIRHPHAVRPWQHVMDPVGFYLALAERLTMSPEGVDEAWNIGPEADDTRAVIDVADALVSVIGRGRVVTNRLVSGPHEANLLTLDCAKAKAKLGWKPRLRFDQAIRWTAEWYAAWDQGRDMMAFTKQQIADFYEA
jgi:CDP-glucose 4,6-dehydratase